MREILKMIIVLGLICGASGFSLSLINDITKGPKELARLKNVKEPAVKKVLTGYDNDPIKDRINIPVGKDKYGKPVNLVVFPAKKGGKTYAAAFETHSKGYGGDIDVMVGLNTENKELTGISILKHSETPGLGARITEGDFTDSFAGQSLDGELSADDINAISGATVSSDAVVKAVNQAGKVFDKYKDQIVK